MKYVLHHYFIWDIPNNIIFSCRIFFWIPPLSHQSIWQVLLTDQCWEFSWLILRWWWSWQLDRMACSTRQGQKQCMQWSAGIWWISCSVQFSAGHVLCSALQQSVIQCRWYSLQCSAAKCTTVQVIFCAVQYCIAHGFIKYRASCHLQGGPNRESIMRNKIILLLFLFRMYMYTAHLPDFEEN